MAPCATPGDAERQTADAFNQDGNVPLISPKPLLGLLLVIAFACTGEPTALSTGNLQVVVSGLPSGSSGDLVVNGPDGYSQGVTATQTLTGLAPGPYTVVAADVVVGTATYSGSPATQSITVGGSTAVASVQYSAGGGTLSVTIDGLGTASNAAVTVSGPNGFSRTVTATETLSSLVAGPYSVTAQNVVAAGGTVHSPSPAIQNVTLASGGNSDVSIRYAPPSTGDLNLKVAALYVTQSAQTVDASVPLVKDRDGYLRVFVVASRTNTAAPAVRVSIYSSPGSTPVTMLIPAPSSSVPTTIDESALTRSWNASIPGALIQPGFSIDAEVDPAGSVFESDETDNLLAPPAPVVRSVPTLNVTFIPIVQQRHAARGDVGNVTAENRDTFLFVTRKMHPVSAVHTVVHAPYTTKTLDTLQENNTNGAWGTILEEIEALRVLENSSRYYYGVAKVGYRTGVAGVAYVSSGPGERSALGWDFLPSGASVAAHELGHNWARNHAPCGRPTGLDNSYPFSDGRIGVFGVDVAARSLKPSNTSDIMGYCDPKWIGAYTYRAVMDYLLAPPAPPAVRAAAAGGVQPSLLVWGRIHNGVMVLEPALHVRTRPTLPHRGGPYVIAAKSEDGRTLFSFSFTPSVIADAPGDQQSFVFAVPLSDRQAAQLASLRLTGQGLETELTRSPGAAPQQGGGGMAPLAQVRRVGSGRVGIQWDALAHPMVMVRDTETGEVLSLARGGSVHIETPKREVDLVLSDGLRSTVRRVGIRP
jgi:hypothetical protein